MSRPSWAPFLLLSLALAACGDEADPLPDAGQSADASSGADAGGDADAGGTADAGACADPITIPISRPDVAIEPPYIYELPMPSGSHAVGTHTIVITDPDRLEHGTPDPSDPRVFVMQLFYPSDESPARPAPLMEAEVALAFAAAAPNAVLDFNRHVLTRSTFDVPISSAQPSWPVVIYSHGLGGFRFESQPLLEELASRGYIVASLSHPYSSGGVLLPSGVTTLDAPSPRTLAEYEVYLDELDDRIIRDHQGDMGAALETLTAINGETCSWLNGRFDLTKVGVVGFSFGGASALRWCANEARCLAGAGMDGHIFIDDLGAELPMIDKPLMMMLADRYDIGWDRISGANTEAAYAVRVYGANHGDLSGFRQILETLIPTLTPMQLGYGTIDGARVERIRSDYVNAFLDHHLRGESVGLLSAMPSPYPEVFFEKTPLAPGSQLSWFGFASRVRFGNVMPLAGASVTAVGSTRTASTTADANGRFRLFGLAGTGLLGARIEHVDIRPTLFSLESANRSEHGQPLYIPSRQEIDGLALGAARVLDPSRGQLVITVVRGLHGVLLDPQAGAVVTSVSSTVAFGYVRAQRIDPALGQTSGDGRALLFNVEPGTWSGTVTLAGAVCETLSVGGPDAPGTVRALVEAGSVSIRVVQCE